VDPKGKLASSQTVVGGQGGGFFEAFASDARNVTHPQFFVTEDIVEGALRRFRLGDGVAFGWEMLQQPGSTTLSFFLQLSAYTHYQNAEGSSTMMVSYHLSQRGKNNCSARISNKKRILSRVRGPALWRAGPD
jgi:hypothetical protein